MNARLPANKAPQAKAKPCQSYRLTLKFACKKQVYIEGKPGVDI